MDIFNINKKKLDIKNDNAELKDFSEKDKYTRTDEAISGTSVIFDALGCKTCEKGADIAKIGVDIFADKDNRANKEAERGGIEEEVNRFYNIKEPEKKYFKKLREEENEKRLKEQQMDKNITSPTSSLTKPVMLASGNSVATDGFVDYGVSNDAFSTLQISNDKFIVTRADINESLEDIFSIECLAYINLVKKPLYEK